MVTAARQAGKFRVCLIFRPQRGARILSVQTLIRILAPLPGASLLVRPVRFSALVTIRQHPEALALGVRATHDRRAPPANFPPPVLQGNQS
jgi:hypothetical protein